MDDKVKDTFSTSNSTPGIITEQGYVAGTGLGFTPLSEDEKEKLKELNKEKE